MWLNTDHIVAINNCYVFGILKGQVLRLVIKLATKSNISLGSIYNLEASHANRILPPSPQRITQQHHHDNNQCPFFRLWNGGNRKRITR